MESILGPLEVAPYAVPDSLDSAGETCRYDGRNARASVRWTPDVSLFDRFAELVGGEPVPDLCPDSLWLDSSLSIGCPQGSIVISIFGFPDSSVRRLDAARALAELGRRALAARNRGQ